MLMQNVLMNVIVMLESMKEVHKVMTIPRFGLTLSMVVIMNHEDSCALVVVVCVSLFPFECVG